MPMQYSFSTWPRRVSDGCQNFKTIGGHAPNVLYYCCECYLSVYKLLAHTQVPPLSSRSFAAFIAAIVTLALAARAEISS